MAVGKMEPSAWARSRRGLTATAAKGDSGRRQGTGSGATLLRLPPPWCSSLSQIRARDDDSLCRLFLSGLSLSCSGDSDETVQQRAETGDDDETTQQRATRQRDSGPRSGDETARQRAEAGAAPSPPSLPPPTMPGWRCWCGHDGRPIPFSSFVLHYFVSLPSDLSHETSETEREGDGSTQ
jgi:hypothetical protein